MRLFAFKSGSKVATVNTVAPIGVSSEMEILENGNRISGMWSLVSSTVTMTLV